MKNSHSPHWLYCFQRTFPSANMTLIRGERPVLIDTGFGADFDETVKLITEAGISPEQLTLIANTHYHCDHVGGNHAFQERYHIPIAASYLEGRMVNDRDRDACSKEWLGQPVELYHVDQLLHEGDEIDAGGVVLRVIHTPGHTLGHIAFYAPEDGILICGDTFHADDVAWLNVFREGVGAIYRMMDTLDKLAKLPLKLSFSGHGAVCEQPLAAIDVARRRYEKWVHEPEKIAWHASKRIFAYAMMLVDGMTRAEINVYLLGSHWYHDYCRFMFNVDAVDFVQPLLDEMVRSNAAVWRGDKLCATALYNVPKD